LRVCLAAIAANGSLVGLCLYALEKKGPEWNPLKKDGDAVELT
jgi:hypothetical protein